MTQEHSSPASISFRCQRCQEFFQTTSGHTRVICTPCRRQRLLRLQRPGNPDQRLVQITQGQLDRWRAVERALVQTNFLPPVEDLDQASSGSDLAKLVQITAGELKRWIQAEEALAEKTPKT